MTKVIARHGDMIIFKISKEQVEGKQQAPLKKLTVGLGEVTGHSHEIIALDDSQVIEHHNVSGYDSMEIQKLVERENIYFEVKGQAVIMHEEHEPIILEEGFYVRTVQRQYNPFSKALEKVRD
ncbi:MAG: hypothetical protein KatS3mg035_0969 [Bacteroidia bacterium]|nr:MAG: hypothetical protein KatS3mg035_0969 [Bacteroidia bacterium]